MLLLCPSWDLSSPMDPEMVSAITSWPVPDYGKQLQCFLEFSNFYRQFIHKCSSVAATLKALTSTKVQFQRTTAKEAIQVLKPSFTSAPIFQVPDQHQFIVEVDALHVIGAVLSHQAATDQISYSNHASYSLIYCLQQKAMLTMAIGNCKQGTMKISLEEWWHWLEGVIVHFLFWTGQKNMECIWAAKRLNFNWCCSTFSTFTSSWLMYFIINHNSYPPLKRRSPVHLPKPSVIFDKPGHDLIPLLPSLQWVSCYTVSANWHCTFAPISVPRTSAGISKLLILWK